jgi:hypothetical protein
VDLTLICQNNNIQMKKRNYFNYLVTVSLVLLLGSCSSKKVFIECGEEPFFNPTSDLNERVQENTRKTEYFSQCEDEFDNRFAPISMTRNDALNNFSQRKSKIGLDSVFLSKDEIKGLISGRNVRGLRIYIADEDKDSGIRGILASGAKSNRTDKAPMFSKRFVFKMSGANGKVENLNISKARNRVENVIESDRFSAFFDKESINYILETNNVKGLVFMPGQLKFESYGGRTGYTFIVGQSGGDGGDGGQFDGSSEANRNFFDQGTTSIFLASKMPCPPDCYPPNPKLPGNWRQ